MVRSRAMPWRRNEFSGFAPHAVEGYCHDLSLLFMATPGWPIRALRVIAAALCVGIAAWYSPFLAAVSWHLFHPRARVDYRGLHVLVPWPWTVESSSDEGGTAAAPQGLSLKKTPPSMDRRLTNQSIFVTVLSPEDGVTPEQQHETWLDIFRATHPGAAFDNRTPAAVPSGTSCLSARSHWNQNGVVWTCISVRNGWVADFEGDERDAGVFFKIIGGLKR